MRIIHANNKHHRHMSLTRAINAIQRLHNTRVRSHTRQYVDHIRILTHEMHLSCITLHKWQPPTPTLALITCRSLTPCAKWFSLNFANPRKNQGLNATCSKRLECVKVAVPSMSTKYKFRQSVAQSHSDYK